MKKRIAFTLVEMLVVIAILASLMMPALQSLLDSARQISCLNNLRNLGFGVQGYMVPLIYPMVESGSLFP